MDWKMCIVGTKTKALGSCLGSLDHDDGLGGGYGGSDGWGDGGGTGWGDGDGLGGNGCGGSGFSDGKSRTDWG
jgi:hypothetical protein